MSLLTLVFWLVNRSSSSFCRLVGLAVLFRRFERVHRGSVKIPEGIHETRWRVGKFKRIGTSREGNILPGNARGGESFDHIVLDAPRHRADETFRRRRRVRAADSQYLRNQGRIVWNPVTHDDAAAGPGHANHLLGHVERPRRKHGAEDAHDEVEGLVREFVKIRCIAFLKPAVAQTLGIRAPVSGLDEVGGNVDAEHIGPQPGCRKGGRAVTTAQIQDLKALGDAEAAYESFAARAHALRNLCEVAFFPECLVRIHLMSPRTGYWSTVERNIGANFVMQPDREGRNFLAAHGRRRPEAPIGSPARTAPTPRSHPGRPAIRSPGCARTRPRSGRPPSCAVFP